MGKFMIAGADDLVVSGIGVRTPQGRAPAAAASSRRSGSDENWFDYRAELGRHGYKYLPPACQYLLAATKQALADCGDPDVAAEARGAAVGTNSAASRLHATIDRTVFDRSAAELSPATAPFFSINLFGSRLATEHLLQAFNLTFTTPRVAGFDALQCAIRSASLGRASWLVVGATEAPLDESEPGASDSEEGAATIVLERASAVRERGGRSYGRCDVRAAFLPPTPCPPAQRRSAAESLLAAAWSDLGVRQDDRVEVTAVLDDSEVGRAVASALRADTISVDGAAGCLEPVLQLQARLADGPSTSMVVTAAPQGNVAVACVRREPTS